MLTRLGHDIHAGKTMIRHEVKEARRPFTDLCNETNIREELAYHIYSRFTKGASKAIAAQYLAEIPKWKVRNKKYTPSTLRANVPPYLVNAIAYVTSPFEQGNGSGKETVSQSG